MSNSNNYEYVKSSGYGQRLKRKPTNQATNQQRMTSAGDGRLYSGISRASRLSNNLNVNQAGRYQQDGSPISSARDAQNSYNIIS